MTLTSYVTVTNGRQAGACTRCGSTVTATHEVVYGGDGGRVYRALVCTRHEETARDRAPRFIETIKLTETPLNNRDRTIVINAAVMTVEGGYKGANTRAVANGSVHEVYAQPGREAAVVAAVLRLGWIGMGITVTTATKQLWAGHYWTVIKVRVPDVNCYGIPWRVFEIDAPAELPAEEPAEDTGFGSLTVAEIHLKHINVAAYGDNDRTMRDGLEKELRLRELGELAKLLNAISAANRSGGWLDPVDRNRTLGRVHELIKKHGKSIRIPAPATADTVAEVPRKTVSNYRVEFSNSDADTLWADPVTITAATEDELTAAIARQFADDENPLTDNLTADFDVLGGTPGFESGPVGGLVSISADESVCAFTATRLDTFEIPETVSLDNDDNLMGERVMLPGDRPGRTHVGTVIGAGLDEPTEEIYAAVVVVRCDDGTVRVSLRDYAWRLPKDAATR